MSFSTRVSGREFKELTRPKLKIFLSVDVVGSTALKQKGRVLDVPDVAADHAPDFVNGDWLEFITNFYRDFPSKLIDAFEEIRETRKKDNPSEGDKAKPPLLWKALGDELVFTAELAAPTDAAIHLEALGDAINSSVKSWSEGNSQLPVSFKGTAWVAGFPVGNSEIPMTQNSVKDPDENRIGDDRYDYSGPAIDIGFRIAKFSTPRRLTISAELADLVALDGRMKNRLWAEIPLELKGVLRGRPYPIFWFDCYLTTKKIKEIELAQFEDDMLGRKAVVGSAVKAYLEHWFKTIDDCYLRPFIFDCPEHRLLIPENYPALKLKVIGQLQRIYKPTKEDQEIPDSSEGDAKVEKLKLKDLPPAEAP